MTENQTAHGGMDREISQAAARLQARMNLPEKLYELVERVFLGASAARAEGFPIETLTVHVADDIWVEILKLRESPFFDKFVEEKGLRVNTIMGRPIHVDRTLNDGQARLRYELVI